MLNVENSIKGTVNLVYFRIKKSDFLISSWANNKNLNPKFVKLFKDDLNIFLKVTYKFHS